MKKIYKFILGLLIAVALTGCASSSSKRELNIVLSSPPLSADPQLLYDIPTGTLCKFFCSTLYEYNSDKELVPALAESYDMSEDGLTYTFHLRKNLKWSDGRPITADDFVFGFKRLTDPAVGSNSVYFVTDCAKLKNSVAIQSGEMPLDSLGVYAPDRYTFICELEEPCTFFLDVLTNSNFAPCNEDFFLSTNGKYGSSDETILSSGAYVMDRYEPLATQIHFVKNPYYYDPDAIKLEGVNMQVIGNDQQALMCYESGMVDIMEVGGDVLELAEGDPELNLYNGSGLYYLYVNSISSVPELKNRNIRMALSKSIDRKDITDNLLRSGFSPMTRIIPGGFYFDTDGTDFAHAQDEYDEYAGYDPAKALEYWNKGLNELGTSSLELEFVFNSDKVSVAEAIAAQMEKNLPGLKIKLKGVPFKERVSLRKSGEYDIMLSNWVPDYSDPTSYLALFLSTASAINYSNEEYDSIYEQTCTAEMASDVEGRNRLLHKLEEMLMEDAATIPVYATGNSYLIKSNVKGLQIPPSGTGVIITGLEKEVD